MARTAPILAAALAAGLCPAGRLTGAPPVTATETATATVTATVGTISGEKNAWAMGGSPLARSWPLTWHLGGPAPFAGPVALQVIGHPAAGRDREGAFAIFDGRTDGFLLACNPLAGRARFSVRAVIRPDPSGLPAQRFMTIQDTGGRRVTLEIRLLPDGRWALDTFLLDGKNKRTLRDLTRLHPAGSWHRVELRYDGRTLRSFVDDRPELAGDVLFTPMTEGRTSVGVRIDLRSWYKGGIREIAFGDVPEPSR